MDADVLEKVLGLRRCVSRAREQLALAGPALADDLTRQDVAVYNVVRACAAATDLAAHLVMKDQTSSLMTKEAAFQILCERRVISDMLCTSLAALIGFRNAALRSVELDLNIVVDVIQHRLDDVLAFADIVLDLSD